MGFMVGDSWQVIHERDDRIFGRCFDRLRVWSVIHARDETFSLKFV